MLLPISPWRSLKTRVTLLTLGICLVSLWSLAFYASRVLREDMQDLLGDQQFSTASIVAAEVNLELGDRLRALEKVASTVTPAMLGDPAALQVFMAQSLILQNFFNGGAFVTQTDGIVTASFPYTEQRGIHLLDSDYMVTVLKDGKPAIGRPVQGQRLLRPVVVMAVPVHDRQGKVIGVLAGTTDLSQPSFLDHVADHTYGLTGGYLLIDSRSRTVVTATDKTRIMQALPGPGVSLAIDGFLQGYEGSAVFINPLEVEVLASAKAVPLAGWYLLASLPTEEAFGLIRAMQRRVLLAALLMTLLAGALTWWLVKRQLVPLLATTSQLVAMADDSQPMHALAMTGPDEVVQLIGGFNHLMKTVGSRESDLREREAFGQAILNSVSAEIAVLDRHGVIVEVNQPWLRFSSANCLELCNPAHRTGVGTNYRAICLTSAAGESSGALDAHAGIRSVIDGSLPNFSLEYPCHSPAHERWFSMSVTPLGSDVGGAVISHSDITERRQAQQALQSSLLEKEALLKEVHHRVKNNLQVINSLLRLESERRGQPGVQSVLSDMQGRIRSMALLHESLYHSGTLATVDLGNYLKQLAMQSFRALASHSGAVQLQLDLALIEVGMDQAMPCGLLVNELISNCLNHGFPQGRNGEVRVELAMLDGGARLRMRVSDTGIGLPDDFESRRGHSLGLQLVSDLATQLGGTLEIGPTPRPLFTVTFAREEYKLR